MNTITVNYTLKWQLKLVNIFKNERTKSNTNRKRQSGYR